MVGLVNIVQRAHRKDKEKMKVLVSFAVIAIFLFAFFSTAVYLDNRGIETNETKEVKAKTTVHSMVDFSYVLVAADGTICRVTMGKYMVTKINDEHRCNWGLK